MKNCFALRLRKERTLACLNQKQLGDILECKYTSISSYEKGRSEPNFDRLIKTAEIFQVSTDYLLGISNERNHEKINKRIDAEILKILSKLDEDTKENIKLHLKLILKIQQKSK